MQLLKGRENICLKPRCFRTCVRPIPHQHEQALLCSELRVDLCSECLHQMAGRGLVASCLIFLLKCTDAGSCLFSGLLTFPAQVSPSIESPSC
jgi:hypothetical protein